MKRKRYKSDGACRKSRFYFNTTKTSGDMIVAAIKRSGLARSEWLRDAAEKKAEQEIFSEQR